MAEVTELEKLKARLGISDEEQDTKLNVLLDEAEDEALNYCNRDKVVDGMKASIRKLAFIAYQSEGTELYASESQGGRSVSYKTGDELPKEIKRGLNRYRVGRMRKL